RDRSGGGDLPGQPVVQLGDVGCGHRPGVIAGLRVGVAVVYVSRVAAEQGADAALLVGAVDGVDVRRARVGPLAAQLGGGGQELGVGDRDGAVDGRHDDVDVRVVGS